MVSSSRPRVLGGKYRLVRQLDAGSMGSVWLAEHLSLNSAVAVKLIAKELADTQEGEQRFLREARSAASLRSPHVVQILDYGVDDGTPYIVMELLEGETLAERLERVGRLSPGQTARILRHIARAVGRAHEAGIIHRDLKPANIFLVANEEEEIAKVLDFGIAKVQPEAVGVPARATRTGTFLGTPSYASPEQAEGVKSLDFRTDIWALGVIAFECLIGEPPFRGPTFGSLLLAICSRPLPVPSERGSVPAGFDGWFARACAREPADRFASAREASSELQRLLELEAGEHSVPLFGSAASRGAAGVPGALSGPPVSVGSRTTSGTSALAAENVPHARQRARWAVVAAVACVAIALGAGTWFRPASPSEEAAGQGAAPQALAAVPNPTPTTPSQAALAALPEPAAALPSDARTGGETSVPALEGAASPAAPVPALVVEVRKVPEPSAPAGSEAALAQRRARTKPASAARPKASVPSRAVPTGSALSSAPAIDLGLGPAKAADCEPPWYIDSKGVRHVKPTCY